jgi:Sec-independent protein secretion pathway component TatC
MTRYTLSSPFMDLEFAGKPKHWRLLVASWFLFWIGTIIGLLYGYVIVFPAVTSFETALLLGVGLLVLAQSGDG